MKEQTESMPSIPLLIAIDGFGAAGKTTLAGNLSQTLGSCPVIHMDDFCHPPSGQHGEWWGESIRGYGFDVERCRDQVLLPARREQMIQYQKLDWDSFALVWTPPIDITAPFLIIEGCCSLHRDLRDLYQLRVWLDSPGEGLFERVAARDGEHMLQHWTNDFLPAARAYEQDHDPRSFADIVLVMGDGPERIVSTLTRMQKSRMSE